MGFKYDIIMGVSMPMPDVFKINDMPGTSTLWKYTKQDTNPHNQAYVQSSDAIDNTRPFASIVSTRYGLIQDGSWHLSFNMANRGIFGALFRYTDQFSH